MKKSKAFIKYERVSSFEFLKFKRAFNGFSGIYHDNIHLFESFSLLLIILVLSSLISLFFKSMSAFIFSLSLFSYLICQYLVVKSQLRGIKIKRIFEKSALEEEKLEIEYRIYNPSSFDISEMYLVDFFQGTKEKFISFTIDEIKAKTVYKKKVFVKLDQGMGDKRIGPMVSNVHDPFHIFNYRLEYYKNELVMVLPKVTDIPIEGHIKSHLSIGGGVYNIQSRGESTNFIGTKEYIQGEPIKKVNWKLSLKQRKLILNEYEKDTNAKVLVIFDLDKVKHFGDGAHSTWEYVKDIGLSIVNKHNHMGNATSAMSQDFFVDFNTGSSHLELIESLVARGELTESEDYKIPFSKVVDRETNIYYITTFVQAMRNIEHLKKLKELSFDHQVNIVFVDPYSFYFSEGDRSTFVLLKTLKQITDEKLIPYLKENVSDTFMFEVIKINKNRIFSGQVMFRGMNV